MVSVGNHTNIKLDEGMVRHMVLNSIRSYNHKFKNEYGETVICVDAKRSWRKDVYPYYKANRKKTRDASELDWNEVFRIFDTIREEIKEFFPYRVVKVDSAEADDIIGTLVFNYGKDLINTTDEKILIMSGDKDFVQLHTYSNVKQYDIVRKRWITHPNPKHYLIEHILKGDVGDGVPNVLSPDDVFVTGGRQKPMTEKRLIELQKCIPETHQRNFMRNTQTIDLSYIPLRLQEEIIDTYNSEQGKSRSKLFNYFLKYQLKHLMEHIGEF